MTTYRIEFGKVGTAYPVPPITVDYADPTKAGREVAAHAIPHLTPVLTELGHPEYADCFFRTNEAMTYGEFMWLDLAGGKGARFCPARLAPVTPPTREAESPTGSRTDAETLASPTPPKTGAERFDASSITDDQLDQLYGRIETLEHVARQNRDHAWTNARLLLAVEAECDAIEREQHGQHDEDADGMRDAVHRIRAVLNGEGQPPAEDACRLVDTDAGPIHVRGASAMTEQERGYAAEIIRAAKRKYAAEHQQPTTEEADAEGSES